MYVCGLWTYGSWRAGGSMLQWECSCLSFAFFKFHISDLKSFYPSMVPAWFTVNSVWRWNFAEPQILLAKYVFCESYAISLCTICTAKNQCRKFETNNPRKGIARPQSQFHIHVSVSVIYFHDWSAYSAAGKYVDGSWEYVNRSQTHECGN